MKRLIRKWFTKDCPTKRKFQEIIIEWVQDAEVDDIVKRLWENVKNDFSGDRLRKFMFEEVMLTSHEVPHEADDYIEEFRMIDWYEEKEHGNKGKEGEEDDLVQVQNEIE